MRPFSEAVRARDLHRYYQPWLDAQSLVNAADGRAKGLTYEGYEPKASRDKVLTAFAQLAALRLNVRRAMVSLIDSNRQYILAEATRTLSLVNQSVEHEDDDLWLGHTILKRDDAVCHHTFGSTYTAKERNGDSYTATALVIPDCREDPRVSFRDYVKSEPGVRFYAGVPIVTKAGHAIGVYAVSDEEPRDGLMAAEVRFMQDMSCAVMEHLELAKDSDARITGERMVRGLTEFIERSSMHESRGASSHRQTTLERQTENARLEAMGDEESPTAIPTRKHSHRKRETERETDMSRIFQRAARIMRQSTHADGVVFFDTSAASMSTHTYCPPDPSASSEESQYSSTTAGSTTATRKRRRAKSTLQTASDSDVGGVFEAPQSTTETKPCPIVGLSIRGGAVTINEAEFVFTEASMERYITRYPQGKYFNFDSEGTGIHSSDEKSERSDPEHSENAEKSKPLPATTQRSRRRREQFVPNEILKALPNVRSLIFLPLWDAASERWTAGGFIWTTSAGRLLNPENELPYLKAFGNSITSELGRWTAHRSDRAKTTFIASISHELRSPLHGILGSVEFLRDTVSSGYQQSLVSSIETCGKTLLDTIDHVLDYAKINKLRTVSSRRKHRSDGRAPRLPADNSILGVTTVFNLAQLVEEVCDTVCAGHAFRKTRDVHSISLYDQGNVGRPSVESPSPHGSGSDRVVVTLNVAPFVNWTVRTQPGALRRVVMNLLGNALKYTDAGFVTVSLIQKEISRSAHTIDFELCVEDSGRGMSSEYQDTKLFAPFSQENPFASGTGLGLSIVKQIVDSLKGVVEVESAPNAGTKISVGLRLPTGPSEKGRTSPGLLPSPDLLKNKIASVVFPSSSVGGYGEKLRDSMALACSTFAMKTVEEFDIKSNCDFLLTEAEALFQILAGHEANGEELPLPAIICICTDPAEKTETETRIRNDFPSLHGIIEVMAQPCGPRKLAASFLEGQTRASRRVETLQTYPTHGPPLDNPSPNPQVLVQRSTSDFVRGNNANSHSIPPPSFARPPSPLISAAMPTTSAPLASLNQSNPDTPASETASEYFSSRVLLVDDNAINLRLLVVFAQRQNLRYETANDGLQALNTFRTEALASGSPSRPFDFVLMDLQMPVMGGLESTRKIREFESEHGLKKSTIVALTGLASERDQQDAVDAGVDMYLVKPVKFADVKRVFGAR